MTVRIESTVLINRPPEEVFALALDFEKAPMWDPDTDSVVRTSQGPVGVGTTFVVEQEVRGKRRKSTMRLTGIEANRRIDTEAQLGPKFSPTMTMTFRPSWRHRLRGTADPGIDQNSAATSVAARAAPSGGTGAYAVGVPTVVAMACAMDSGVSVA